MISRKLILTVLPALSMVVFLVSSPVQAAGKSRKKPERTWDSRTWRAISEEEMALTEVPGHPGVPAVILLKSTRLVLSREGVGSRRDHYYRIKVLTDEGRKYGSISIPSSDYDRIRDLFGRVVLPDGRRLDLPDDAIFQKDYSDYYREQVTSFAMPEVAGGAIVEFSYSIYFDKFLRTWEFYFQDRLPVRRSEISLEMPPVFEFGVNLNDPRGQAVKPDIEEGPRGLRTLTYVLENLPPIPEEPFALPWQESSARVAFVPKKVHYTTGWKEVHDTWENLVQVVQDQTYSKARARTGQVAAMARELTAGVAGPREQAEILFRFVRDEIGSPHRWDPEAPRRTLDQVLGDREGDDAEQALLLHKLLESAGIKTSVGWSSPRSHGVLDRAFPLYSRVRRWIVAAEIEPGRKTYLQPTDPDLAFGALEPELEDVPCLLVDETPPAWVYTSLSQRTDSQRTVALRLQVSEEGEVSGTGTMELTGHQAWRYLGLQPTIEKSAAGWKEWLTARFPTYEVADVEVQEDVDGRRVAVAWSLRLRPQEVLGDEVSLPLAAPLAIRENPLIIPAERRYSPVHLPFLYSDEVNVEATWPEGWELDIPPRPATLNNQAARFTTSVEIDQAAHSLKATRRLEFLMRDFRDSLTYTQLQETYSRCVTLDAQPLVLVKR